MGQNLPPLGALRAFEAAARRASFKDAAGELFVTPTAISHQIRHLEAQLGVKVLSRSPRAVVLTAEGRILYDAVVQSFSEIRRAVTQLQRGGGSLTLSATSAFLAHWLMPRLPQLQACVPGIDLRLHTSDMPVSFEPGGVDAAIRYGKGPFAGLQTTALKPDAFAPVASPSLGLRRLADLRKAALIHIDGRTRPRPVPDWRRWCARAGITGVDTGAGLRFTDGMQALQAAIAGQGVVIASLVLVEDALASGLLVKPFAPKLPGDTYHFVAPAAAPAGVDLLRRWFAENLR